MRFTCFLRYATERYRREQREISFMAYVTDSLRLKAENKYITKRWYDMVFAKPHEEMDAEAILKQVITGAGLEVIHREPIVTGR